MIKDVMDQRKIQSRGGIFSKYPSSAVISRILRAFNIEKVIDVTYGRGRFYFIYRPRLLIGVDARKWDWIVKPDMFFEIPVQYFHEKVIRKEISFDVDCIVVDPPKWNLNNYNKRDEYNFIIGTPSIIINYARKIAEELKSKYLLVHYNKILDGKIAYLIEYKFFSRYLNIKNNNNTSYFILYEINY